jgi:hypothetical protein
MAWTEDQKVKAIAAYEAGGPTPENSTELIKEIAEELEQSPNGVRMILVQAGVYVKKEASASSSTGTKAKASGDAPKRVSKESQIAELRKAIEAAGAEADDEVLDKLTGKAAAYFAGVITQANKSE